MTRPVTPHITHIWRSMISKMEHLFNKDTAWEESALIQIQVTASVIGPVKALHALLGHTSILSYAKVEGQRA